MIFPVLVRNLVAGPLEIDAGEMPVSEQLVQAGLNGQAILVQHILAEYDFIADALRFRMATIGKPIGFLLCTKQALTFFCQCVIELLLQWVY